MANRSGNCFQYNDFGSSQQCVCSPPHSVEGAVNPSCATVWPPKILMLATGTPFIVLSLDSEVNDAPAEIGSVPGWEGAEDFEGFESDADDLADEADDVLEVVGVVGSRRMALRGLR